jgi:hypothetical protein
MYFFHLFKIIREMCKLLILNLTISMFVTFHKLISISTEICNILNLIVFQAN